MKLLALRCPECNQPLAAENDHIVVSCERCHTAVHIGDEGLTRVPVHYAAPREGVQVTRWLPFWVFHGRVHITQRDTQGRGSGDKEAARLWGQPRYLYVPAWNLSLQTTQKIGGSMIQLQPVFQPVPQPAEIRLTPVTFTADDALKMLEFVVLAIEARRPDWLKSLAFRLEVGEPELWALPAGDEGIVALD
jgi:phage FluMu protein Com